MLDCYYYNNNCHIEKWGGHRYLRPSNCSKFVLKRSEDYFFNEKLSYSYHGTHPNNIKNILKEGLKVPDGNNIKVENG